MHIVLCLDDRNGMLFNKRRLSSDIAVCQRVYTQHSGNLLVSSYSAKLFAGMDVCVDDQLVQNAAEEDTCFVENLDFADYLSSVSAITVYRWNRHYPSDVKFPQQLLDGWRLTEKTDFSGNSHEIITEERYVR